MGGEYENLCICERISSHFEAHFSIFYSKVRHSNTLFFAINFAFPCQALGALVRLCYFIVAHPWPTK